MTRAERLALANGYKHAADLVNLSAAKWRRDERGRATECAQAYSGGAMNAAATLLADAHRECAAVWDKLLTDMEAIRLLQEAAREALR